MNTLQVTNFDHCLLFIFNLGNILSYSLYPQLSSSLAISNHVTEKKLFRTTLYMSTLHLIVSVTYKSVKDM